MHVRQQPDDDFSSGVSGKPEVTPLAVLVATTLLHEADERIVK